MNLLANYLKLAYRKLIKNLTFSLINIFGLSIGICAFLLILEYISFESSVDQYHEKLPSLYRVITESKDKTTFTGTPPGYAKLFKSQLPEIMDYCRIAEGLGKGIIALMEKQEINSFREDNPVYADASFFSLFTVKILSGNAREMSQPNRVALSSSYARKYFGESSPLGKSIEVNNQFGKTAYLVACVFQDLPDNSNFKYDIVLSLETLASKSNLNGSDWADLEGLYNAFLTTWVELSPEVNTATLPDKMNKIVLDVKPEEEQLVSLQPLTYTHLGRSLSDNDPSSGNLAFMYVLGGIALIIILIAWFNYVNLSTASALSRAKEVGVRKITGASRNQLIAQFLGESLLLNTLSFFLGLALVNLFQPLFNSLVERQLSLAMLLADAFWLKALFFVMAGSLISGAYIAFALSSFKPMTVLKGTFTRSSRGIRTRRALVIAQFAVSVALLSGTIVLYRQLTFMKSKSLGMDLSQLLVFRGPELGKDSSFAMRSQSFKAALSQMTFVDDYAATGCVPGKFYNFSIDGVTKQNPLPGDEKETYQVAIVDEKFFSTYKITLLRGRNFTEAECARIWNNVEHVIINEQAAIQLGFATPEEAVGQKIDWGKALEVVAVAQNYHHTTLKESIAPVIFYPQHNGQYFSVRLTRGNEISDNVKRIQKLFNEHFAGNPFDFFFADNNFNAQYVTEERQTTIFITASLFALLIAALGLFGLATYSVEQRTKELSIRKVLGATSSELAAMISREFVGQVVIGVLLAIPLTLWAANEWLNSFAYREDVSWWTFALAGGIAIIISVITVSGKSLSASARNPVDHLKQE